MSCRQKSRTQFVRTHVVQRRVPSPTVVEHLYVFTYCHACLVAVKPIRTIHKLFFQCSEEGLDHSVVVAAPLRAHAAHDPSTLELLAVTMARVLAPTVGVMDELVADLSGSQRALEGLEDELGLHVIGHRPADDATAEQVEDDG